MAFQAQSAHRSSVGPVSGSVASSFSRRPAAWHQRLHLRTALAVAIASVTLGSGLFGCDKISDAVAKKAKEETEKAIKEGGTAPVGNGPDLFVDATSIPTKFKEKIGGPTRVLELLVYPGYAHAQIQDPKKKLEANEFEYRGGTVGDSAPIKWIGKEPTEKDLEFQTFDINDVDFSKVPAMVKEAPAKAEVADGKVTHMILKRPLPFEKEVRWRIYVNGERKDGSVEYDAKGVFKKKY